MSNEKLAGIGPAARSWGDSGAAARGRPSEREVGDDGLHRAGILHGF